MRHENFCDFQTAKMLREIGYDDPCMAYYKTTGSGEYYLMKADGEKNSYWKKGEDYGIITAPLWQEIKQWLWKNHKIQIQVKINAAIPSMGFNGTAYDYSYATEKDFFEGKLIWTKPMQSPIEAEIEIIKMAVKIKHI